MKTHTPRRHGRTQRSVEHARSYGLLLRAADTVAGRRDRRGAGAGSALEARRSPWPSRLEATGTENCTRVLVMTADRLKPVIEELRGAFGAVTLLDREVTEVRKELDALAPSIVVKRGGEQHLSQEQVTDRRARKDEAHLTSKRAHLTDVKARRDALLIRCVDLRAELAEEFELAREVADRLGWYYTRRLRTYARARLHGAVASEQDRADSQGAGQWEWVLKGPSWVDQQCPWYPDGLDARLALHSTPTTTPTATTVEGMTDALR